MPLQEANKVSIAHTQVQNGMHKLIYDVGFNDGGDTAHYLTRGYDVLAIEANPQRVEAGKERFAREIAAGRLTILNVGIGPAPGTFPFWINEANDRYSSFEPALARRDNLPCHQIPISCRTFSEILAEYGTPHYLKIDIEGCDHLCVEALTEELPKYVSLELHHTDSAGPAHSLGTIRHLADLGYTKFKLINQYTFTDSMPIFRDELGMRILYRLYRRNGLCRSIVNTLPAAVHPKKQEFDIYRERLSYAFPKVSSGPFGEDTYGPWRSISEITERAQTLYNGFTRNGIPLIEAWFDVHASY